MTSRQLLLTVEGLTHASSVIAVVSRTKAESVMVTRAEVPLNTRAVPKRPAVVQVAPLMVPVLPLPDRSVTVVPVPSLKAYAATRPATTAPLLMLVGSVAVLLAALLSPPP